MNTIRTYSTLGNKALKALAELTTKVDVKSRLGGYQYVGHFENGYDISVIKFGGTYGEEDDLWEIAVMNGGEIIYDTPITNDVIGWLTDDEVIDYAKQICELERRS